MTVDMLSHKLNDLKKIQADEVEHNKVVDPTIRMSEALEKIEVVLEFIALIGMQLLETSDIPNTNDSMDVD